MMDAVTGGTLLAECLASFNVEAVFTVPGSQNVAQLEELRSTGIRIVAGTSELSAAFMTNGHARVRRSPAVITTIPGPGFTFALPGIAEARLDSVPLVWICIAPTRGPDGGTGLQELPQVDIASPLVKEVVPVDRADEVVEAFVHAFEVASTSEPGPVLLHVAPTALRERTSIGTNAAAVPEFGRRRAPAPSDELLDAAVRAVADAVRPLIFVGQGGLDDPHRIRRLAELLGGPVLTTTTARGVVSEHHPLVMPTDGPGDSPELQNRLIEEADLVLVLGAGLSFSGSCGYRLRIPEVKMVRIDSSADALGEPYPARIEVHADVRTFLDRALGDDSPLRSPRSKAARWPDKALAGRRKEFAERLHQSGVTLQVTGQGDGSVRTLLSALQEVLPDDALIVTDSGRHQMLARRWLTVKSPGALMTPSDLQSMGFGLPAALGAKVAAPDREVVALIGDGGFQVTMGELLVAAREGLGVRVLVFVDNELGLIAEDQRRNFGRTVGTSLVSPDLSSLSQALGARFLKVDGSRHAQARFEEMLGDPGPTVVEVPLSRSFSSKAGQAKALARESVRGLADSDLMSSLRRMMGQVRRRE